MIKNIKPKQAINYTSSIINTNKNWKQFIQTKTQNQSDKYCIFCISIVKSLKILTTI